MPTSILQVQGLTKKYNRFTLGPLDLQVEQGVVVGLVGANGSGKSTLLRLLMNVINEDAGKVYFFERGWKDQDIEWKSRVGYAGELLGAYDFLTIKEIKHLICRWYPAWNEDRFRQLSKRYKIDINEKYGKCSKGTKKKVDFILTLCHNPELLLLDEPTAGVDIVSQRKMKEDLIRFMEDGEKSIVLATHTIDEINTLCDEIIVLDSGRVVHTFNKDEIYENWARIWISDVTATVKNHTHVLRFETSPPQIVTSQVEAVEKALQKEEITIYQVQRLSIEEVLEYLIDEE